MRGPPQTAISAHPGFGWSETNSTDRPRARETACFSLRYEMKWSLRTPRPNERWPHPSQLALSETAMRIASFGADCASGFCELSRVEEPTVGETDRRALALAREQVRIANEIWIQCAMEFGDPSTADISIVDPPPPSLLSIADEDGLRAAGDGHIVFRANGRRIGPVPTRRGAEPVETALDVAAAAERAGFATRVTENAPTEFGAGRSADLQLRNARGHLVELSPDGRTPAHRRSTAVGSDRSGRPPRWSRRIR